MDDDVMVPWGYGGRKIRLKDIENDPIFKDIAPMWQKRILKMIQENPTIGVGASARPEPEVVKLFNERYKPFTGKLDYNDPKVYQAFKEGKYKEYNGQIYKLKAGKAAAATPNASWHTGGFAVDLVGDTKLAGEIADRYGIRQVTSNNETWHFQPKGMPDGRRVIDFLKSQYGYDIPDEGLSVEALAYINDNFASNSPVHPKKVLDDIRKLIGKDMVHNKFKRPKDNPLSVKKLEHANRRPTRTYMPSNFGPVR
jgi:hypothetical protein